MCSGLKELMGKLGRDNFDYIERFSDAKEPGNWDSSFIEKSLMRHSEREISKIWVCGPPRMTETFDRTLKDLAQQFNLDPLT